MVEKYPKAQIVLSTYNGELYLKELLDSLLMQDYPNVQILIRDDGSKDSTLSIISAYEDLPNIEVQYGDHIGVVNSFLSLSQSVADDTEYVAFCDQDDVWMKDKLSRAVSKLEETIPRQTPGMYCGRYVIVDEALQVRGYSQLPKRGPSLENALVQNIAAGCTTVINKAARYHILKELPCKVRMHDWWCYQVVSALGEVVYDPEPAILYRQHSSNTIGHKLDPLNKWISRLGRFIERGRLPLVTDQAVELMRIFGDDLTKDKRYLLGEFINGRDRFFARIKYAMQGRVYRQSILDDIILRILIVLNRV